MIGSFRDQATEDVFNGDDTKEARRVCPPALLGVARRKLDMINAAASVQDLRAPPGNRLEALRGNRQGEFSIRINDQYRICFRWQGREALDVQIVDYHS
jgi:proteic killer suppression protein